MITEDALNIYTDGSSFNSPRKGGIGIRYITVDSYGNEHIQNSFFPGYKGATNNQMELQACIQALKEALQLQLISNVNRIFIFTDSLYVVDNYKRAMFNWSANKWFSQSGKPVINADLWKDLLKVMKKIRKNVEFKWVKGHSKNIHNKAVDKMARASAKLAVKEPLSHVNVRRKISSKSVDQGSVTMKGQRISIRIITCEYLRVQNIWKSKYEVISKNSRYCGNVDFIFCKQLMGAGHSYYVRVNDDTVNPWVVQIFREIDKK